MFELEIRPGESFSLCLGGKLILCHTPEKPAVFLGRGRASISMFRGNFDIRDRVSERIALRPLGCADGVLRLGHPALSGEYRLRFTEREGRLEIDGECDDAAWNRLWLRLYAEEKEHVVGGGEQFSALDLRGRLWPIWTREQGVGRNKLTEITRLADELDGSGGDYHTTFFPQPTLLSSRLYLAHLQNYEYAELDLREPTYHEIGLWSTKLRLVLAAGDSFPALLEKLTALLGRQPALPDWAMRGLWLGVQGGTERATALEKRCRDAGVDISAVWIQDWEGKRVTSFGKRLQWDWRWNREMYPGLDEIIQKDRHTAWMGYINPYLVEGGVLFREAAEKGYFVRNSAGGDYLFDFGEFDCGVVDLSDHAAFTWYKEVIKKNLIGMGFKGWMADFGEYLPADAVCRGGSGLALHNAWPMLWARCNREAVEEAGKLGDCVFFMRSGAAGSQKYSTLLWAGDQCVDWSEDDGLPSVITAALSLGLSGFGLHTCDIGGYTTLFHLHRDEELMRRWLEFAAFTPVMRTHEGNRPDANVQLYDSPELLAFAARMTKIHDALLPYLRHCVEENASCGLPVMRPLFFAEPEAEEAWDHRRYSYLLGDELLVAPVVEPGADSRRVWLPKGSWIHLWSGAPYTGGWAEVPAPLGEPPVFYRRAGEHAPLFEEIRSIRP